MRKIVPNKAKWNGSQRRDDFEFILRGRCRQCGLLISDGSIIVLEGLEEGCKRVTMCCGWQGVQQGSDACAKEDKYTIS
jgi:hypothetical protein